MVITHTGSELAPGHLTNIGMELLAMELHDNLIMNDPCILEYMYKYDGLIRY